MVKDNLVKDQCLDFVNAALVDSQTGGQTTSSASLGGAENKRPRNVDCLELPAKDSSPAVDVNRLKR
ncbi:jg2038 [Pararge aegeria aegeria]|uniref:Jg2038 protein n=1 Tax=Pararge aegeria aegeria TaxID=348720 RepID=A0A8S4R974_9NEOP|nr:jg2038 [Pararge aegeria aegeria]